MVQVLNLAAHHALPFSNWSKIYSHYFLALPSDVYLLNRV